MVEEGFGDVRKLTTKNFNHQDTKTPIYICNSLLC